MNNCTQLRNNAIRHCFRSPDEIMDCTRLGKLHPSRLSFCHTLVRKMIAEKWVIKQRLAELDKEGYGYTVFTLTTPIETYEVLFFTQYISDEQRNDRVIAEQWDITCCLYQGELSQADIKHLQENLPHQEKGTYSPKVLSISRANKSNRLFNHIIQRLAQGNQPDLQEIKKVGYLVRTTAVYGNGKFTMADYQQLQETSFKEHFMAQLFLVYMARHFTFCWAEHQAKALNPKLATTLSKPIQLALGVGNSTGLGMAPYLIRHNDTVNDWVKQREQALYQIFNNSKLNPTAQTETLHYLRKGSKLFAQINVPDPDQQQANQQLSQQLSQLADHLQTLDLSDANIDWQILWQYAQQHTNPETQELLLNILLEIHPTIADQYQFYNPRPASIPNIAGQTLNDLQQLIQQAYAWVINIDFNDPATSHYFWYRSENKEEPRLGVRALEDGADKALRIDIANQINQLYQQLKTLNNQQLEQSVAEFLLEHPNHLYSINRIYQNVHSPYGEIQGNIIDKEHYPIDILRMKLAFFGAVKFDPKSDKWLRVCLFQGAPHIQSNGQIDSLNDWFLYTPELA